MTGASESPGVAATYADVATAVGVLAAVVLACTGNYRDVIAGRIVSIGWEEAAFAAGAVAAIRHAAHPRPSILATARRWKAAVVRRPALADAIVAFWLTRPAVIAVGLLGTVTLGLAAGAPAFASRNPLGALPARWDAQWYAGIAADGYQWRHSFDTQQNLAFFPAYPMLVRAAGAATGAFRTGVPAERRLARLTWCGLAVSLASFFWAAWYFARLAREMLDPARARTAVLLLSAYPFAVFFSAAYTESLFLLAALGTWFHFRQGDSARASAWGLLAGLARPNGCFLSIPLGLLAIGMRDAPGARAATPGGSTLVRLAVAAMPGIGMLAFTAYLQHVTGIWFAWSKTHAAWGRVLGAGSTNGMFTGLGPEGLLAYAVDRPYDLLNALGLVAALALIRPVWRLSPAWAVFVIVSLAVPFSAGGLLSIGRLTSTLFPMFLAWAAVLPVALAPAAVALLAMLQGLIAVLFYTWRGVY
jgi:hypothetical protein